MTATEYERYIKRRMVDTRGDLTLTREAIDRMMAEALLEDMEVEFETRVGFEHISDST